jgi:hypothetical protein
MPRHSSPVLSQACAAIRHRPSSFTSSSISTLRFTSAPFSTISHTAVATATLPETVTSLVTTRSCNDGRVEAASRFMRVMNASTVCAATGLAEA